jgi:hypothetical protein
MVHRCYWAQTGELLFDRRDQRLSKPDISLSSHPPQNNFFLSFVRSNEAMELTHWETQLPNYFADGHPTH